MQESIIEMLQYYRRQANSCYGRSAYKTIEEITSVLAEEVPLVKYKKNVIEKSYNSADDEKYTDQLRYLGKMIELEITKLVGIEKKKSEKIEALQRQLVRVNEEKDTLEEQYSSLSSAYSALEDKYKKVLRELASKNNGGNQ